MQHEDNVKYNTVEMAVPCARLLGRPDTHTGALEVKKPTATF